MASVPPQLWTCSADIITCGVSWLSVNNNYYKCHVYLICAKLLVSLDCYALVYQGISQS